MDKNKIKKIERIALGVQAILVLALLGYVYFSSVPEAGSVIVGKSILEPDIVLYVNQGEELYLSTNENFDNSLVVKEGDELQLPPGTYFYKVKNWLRESEVQTFTIESKVGLNLYNRPEGYELENSGNVDLDIQGEKSGITGSLGVDESIDVKEDDTYEGKQK